MELKDGLKVEIKRLTKKGVITGFCVFIESNGVHFGIIKDNKAKEYYLIHLDSGLGVCDIEITRLEKENVFDYFKKQADRIDKSLLEKEVKSKIKDLKQIKGFTFPLN